MIFTLQINLGNDAMQSPANVAEALKVVAEVLSYDYAPVSESSDRLHVVDANGNRVGACSFEE